MRKCPTGAPVGHSHRPYRRCARLPLERERASYLPRRTVVRREAHGGHAGLPHTNRDHATRARHTAWRAGRANGGVQNGVEADHPHERLWIRGACTDFGTPTISCSPVPASPREVPRARARNGTSIGEGSIDSNIAATSWLLPVGYGVNYANMHFTRAHASYITNVMIGAHREFGWRDSRACSRAVMADRVAAHRSDAGSLKTRVSASRHSRVGSRRCVRLAATHGAQPTRRGVERRDAWRIRTASD
jgi:hypothetical protein